MSIVYLNGQFLPLAEAKISVLDRGFIFGEGIYEVIPAYTKRLFRLSEHLQRLEHNLQKIRLPNPLTRPQWTTVLQTLLSENEGDNQSVYLQITRGSAKREHHFPAHSQPTVFAMSEPISMTFSPFKGVKAITCPDTRWQHCDIKTITLLANVLARQQAIESGALEAILIREEQVTEGAASNVFAVIQGQILTPPKSPFILPGITRDLILEILQIHQIPHQESPISLTQLQSAEEIWLTSSVREIIPVVNLNGQSVGTGQPGPIWHRIWQLYQDNKPRFLTMP